MTWYYISPNSAVVHSVIDVEREQSIAPQGDAEKQQHHWTLG